MDHASHIGLVEPEPKRDGRNQNAKMAVHEVGLHSVSLLCTLAGVIAVGVEIANAEVRSEGVRLVLSVGDSKGNNVKYL